MSDVYICNTNGNNTTGAGTDVSPWATIQKGLDNVLVAGGGGTIWCSDLSAFVLAASLDWTAFAGANTTSTDNPLIIRWWDQSGSIVINHPYADVPAFEVDGNDAVSTIFSITSMPQYVVLIQGKFHDTTGKLIDPVNYWNALVCELYGAGASAIWDSANYGIIAGCYLHTFPASCYGIRSGAGIVVGNYIDSPTSVGIDCSWHRTTVENNIIYNAANHGISTGSDRATIRGNTIHGDGSTSYAGININAGAEQITAVNNIIMNFGGTGKGVLMAAGGNALLYGHNHFFDNATNESGVTIKGLDLGNNLTTDPGFVDAAGGDFRIGATGKAKGWPMGWPGSETLNYLDTGAVQRKEFVIPGGFTWPFNN